MVVAVDVGYGYVKAAGAEGRRVSWPTTLRRRAPGGGYAALGQAAGRRVRVQRPGAEPAEYQAGEAGRRAWAADAADRAGYDVQVLAAAAALGAAGDTDVLLGLPLALWVQQPQRRALRDALEGIEATVAVNGGPEARISIRSVRVLPQGAGAFQWALRQDPSLARRPVGLIDVGYRTTDYLVMRRVATGLAPDEASCGSADLGAGQVYERVRAALSEEAAVLVPEGAVEDAIGNYGGQMFLRGREVDTGAQVEEATRTLAAEVTEEIRRAWGDRLPLLGAVLLSGGGGEAVAPFLRDLHPLARPMPDALWANALGFLAMAGATVQG